MKQDIGGIVQVAGRVRAGFDVERVTKRFYERFKAEHAAFLKFLEGIPDEELAALVRLGDAQPADVHLLHPEEGLPRRRPATTCGHKLAASQAPRQGPLLPRLPLPAVLRGLRQAAGASARPRRTGCWARSPT